jgi:hypothetical protein
MLLADHSSPNTHREFDYKANPGMNQGMFQTVFGFTRGASMAVDIGTVNRY